MGLDVPHKRITKIIAFLRVLRVLSERSERARHNKSFASRKDAKDAKKGKIVDEEVKDVPHKKRYKVIVFLRALRALSELKRTGERCAMLLLDA